MLSCLNGKRKNKLPISGGFRSWQKVKFDYSTALQFVNQHEVDYFAEPIRLAHEQLHNGTGTGSDYLGWIDLPTAYDKEEFSRIQKRLPKSKVIPKC